MKRLVYGFFASLALLGALVFIMPTPAYAQCGSADACETAAQNCQNSGGLWNSSTGTCGDVAIMCENGMQASVGDGSSADDIAQACNDECSGSGGFLGFPTWYKYLEVGPETIVNENGGLTVVDSCAVIGPKHRDGTFDMPKAGALVGMAVIEILLRIATIAALAYVIYGGFRYIISQGEPENTKAARQMIMNALIGLTVSLIATGIVAFLMNELTS